jgi:NAD(P)-dependent dehydrogenase (short-subunit alcohol dehydrogenase family)
MERQFCNTLYVSRLYCGGDSGMNLDLDGRRVLVTGGSKGIGLACARGFLAEGARVAITSRSEANLSDARAALGEVMTVAADLADGAAARAMIDRVETELGPIDILVASAGAARRTPPDELNPAAWRHAMDAKYFTYINAIDPLVKLMAARGRGVIVNIVGNGGKVASPIHLPGGAANAALMLATVGLANAYAARGVRVLAINPGLTRTTRVSEGMQAEAARQGISEAEALQRSIDRIPLGRLAEPEEIAAMTVFAASPRASYLTGVVITMDGGSSPIVV